MTFDVSLCPFLALLDGGAMKIISSSNPRVKNCPLWVQKRAEVFPGIAQVELHLCLQL